MGALTDPADEPLTAPSSSDGAPTDLSWKRNPAAFAAAAA